MNGADWVILLVVLASTVQAAYSGFFQEAFHLAGLVAGYLVAAWQYQRVAGLVGEVPEVGLGGRECWIPDHFFCGGGGRRNGRTNRPLGDEGIRSSDCGPASRRGVGFSARLSDRGRDRGQHDRIHAHIELAGGFGVGSVFPGGGRAAIWVAPAELRARFYQGLDLLRRMPQTVPAGAAPRRLRESKIGHRNLLLE